MNLIIFPTYLTLYVDFHPRIWASDSAGFVILNVGEAGVRDPTTVATESCMDGNTFEAR
jgi:hypothetical protein